MDLVSYVQEMEFGTITFQTESELKARKMRQFEMRRKLAINSVNRFKLFCTQYLESLLLRYRNIRDAEKQYYSYLKNHPIPKKKKIRKNAQSKIKAVLITFEGHKKETEDLYKAIYEKLFSLKSLKITHQQGAIEYTKSGLPHLHMYVESRDYIRLSRLKKLWKYSSIDIKKSFEKQGVIKYINKSENRIKLPTKDVGSLSLTRSE